MCRYQPEESRIMKNEVNMTPPKKTNKALITESKEMEIYELSGKEFRTVLLKKFNELQENTDN